MAEDAPFYEESDESEESEEGESGEEREKEKPAKKPKKKPYMMDHDHRLLLKNAKPLLQSRNAAVSAPVGNPCNQDTIILLTIILLTIIV